MAGHAGRYYYWQLYVFFCLDGYSIPLIAILAQNNNRLKLNIQGYNEKQWFYKTYL